MLSPSLTRRVLVCSRSDLKPANILYDRNSKLIKLCDFGLAREQRFDEHLSTLALGAGTPAFCAPEQALAQPLTAAVDVYSCAVLLVLLFCGDRPWGVFNGSELRKRYQQGRTPRLSEEAKQLLSRHPEPAALLQRCLDIDPAKRPGFPSLLAMLRRTIDQLHAQSPSPSESHHDRDVTMQQAALLTTASTADTRDLGLGLSASGSGSEDLHSL